MQWTDSAGGPDFSGIRGMDPAAGWLLGPGGIDDYLGDFLERQGAEPGGRAALAPLIAGGKDLAQVVFSVSPDAGQGGAVLRALRRALRGYAREQGRRPPGGLFPGDAAELLADRAATVTAELRFLLWLAGDHAQARPFREAGKRLLIGPPLRLRALASDGPAEAEDDDAPGPDLTPAVAPGHIPGDAVFVAVIDDGFALAHARFRKPGGASRIAAYWDQEADHEGPLSALPFGRELRGAEIDAALARAGGPSGALAPTATDEGAFYADPALAPFFPHRAGGLPGAVSHGTVVLDLAAELEPGADPDKRPLIAVRLPRSSVQDTTGAEVKPLLIAGVRYALAAARRAAGRRDVKLVICISYGVFAGAMDGDSTLERALDAILEAEDGRVAIVLPSGNGRLDQAVARLGLSAEAPAASLTWRIQPDDRTPSFLQIWGSEALEAADLTLRVTPPGGPQSPPLRLGAAQTRWLRDGASVTAELASVEPRGAGGGRALMLSVRPSETMRPARPFFPPEARSCAPAGAWRLELSAPGLAAGEAVEVLLRAQRDDSLSGFPPSGRQPYFPFPSAAEQEVWLADRRLADPAQGDATVRLDATLNAFATGRHVVVAGACAAATGAPSWYSAGGPVRTQGRDGPDLLAPSDRSAIRAGVIGAGFGSAARFPVSGASVAAPQAAQRLAAALGAGMSVPGGARGLARSLAAADEAAAGWPGPAPSSRRGGAGRLATLRVTGMGALND